MIRKPHSCSMVLLTQCFLRCKMCRMWDSQDDPRKATLSEWKNFISSLKDVLDGPRELVFSGGEPLLYKDIFDLIRFGTESGFKTLMPSNGYLIDGEMARRIADSGLKEMFVSLDSTSCKTHDFLRGKDGACAKTMKALEYLHGHCPDLRLGIIAVISGVNYPEIGGLARWVKETGFLSGVYFQAIAKPFFVPLGDNWYNEAPYDFLWPKDVAGVCAAVDELIQFKAQGYPIHNFTRQLEVFKTYFRAPSRRARKAACYLGDYVINVNPAGDISLCCFDEPLGNIKTDAIRDLWYSRAAAHRREGMHACERNCNNMVNCFFKEDEEAL